MNEQELAFDAPDGVPPAPAPDPRKQAAAYLQALGRWLRDPAELQRQAALARRELASTVDPRGVAV